MRFSGLSEFEIQAEALLKENLDYTGASDSIEFAYDSLLKRLDKVPPDVVRFIVNKHIEEVSAQIGAQTIERKDWWSTACYENLQANLKNLDSAFMRDSTILLNMDESFWSGQQWLGPTSRKRLFSTAIQKVNAKPAFAILVEQHTGLRCERNLEKPWDENVFWVLSPTNVQLFTIASHKEDRISSICETSTKTLLGR